MLSIKTFQFNPLQENTYIVSDDTLECVVIDCGAFYDAERRAVVQYLQENGLRPVRHLLTHGHLDHCFGADTLFEVFGLRPEVHAADEFLVEDLARQASGFFGMDYQRPTPPRAPFLVPDSEVTFGTHSFRILHTPGHTPGCVCFYCEDERMLFSGDTLFCMSVGRTDFERSSWADLLASLRNVISLLPDNVTVYSGHGLPTSIGDEKRLNPYLR